MTDKARIVPNTVHLSRIKAGGRHAKPNLLRRRPFWIILGIASAGLIAFASLAEA